MCNLYNVTTNQQAIRDFITITHFREGNLEPSLNVHRIVRGRSCASTPTANESSSMSTGGMPTPEIHLEDKPDKGVTNVRKTWIPH